MIKGFETGKYYRYTKSEIPCGNWNRNIMGKVIDGFPRRCVNGGKTMAAMAGLSYNNRDYMWDWQYGFNNWEEVINNMVVKEDGSFNIE